VPDTPPDIANVAPHVVILGGGFGGLSAARALARSAAQVTVLDRQNYHLFQPFLYQVATAALSATDIAVPLRSCFRNFPNIGVLMVEVTGIDLADRVVFATGGRQAYDYLILATGSTYSYFGHDEWRTHAPPLKTIGDALDIRRRVLSAFERAECCADPEEQCRLLTFVVVGGGPTGVELAGSIADMVQHTLVRDFRHIDPKQASILLLEAAHAVLGGFPEPLPDYARAALEKKGVTIRLGAPVTGITREGVQLGEGFLPAATVMWSAGVQVPDAANWLGVPPERGGRVPVGPDLSLPGHPEVFVIGDAAAARDADGRLLPGLAAVAKQQGTYVGRLLRARIEGRPEPGPFRYHDRGTMATIGRAAAVAALGRFRFKGRLAWFLWGVVHVYFLIGFRNRLAVLASWAWEYVTYGRGARIITRV
jgi:NADH dehydrogenase